MLTCPAYLPLDFCTQPASFRKSFNGLTGVIMSEFGSSVILSSCERTAREQRCYTVDTRALPCPARLARGGTSST